MAKSEKYYAVAVYPLPAGTDPEDAAREIESNPALICDVLDFDDDANEIVVNMGAEFDSTADEKDFIRLRADVRQAMPPVSLSLGPVPLSVTRIRDSLLIEFPSTDVDLEIETLRLFTGS